MSYINPTATTRAFAKGDRVAYVEFDGKRQWGTVSGSNDHVVWVRFDKQVSILGWEGTTSQACDPRDLVSGEVEP